MSRRIGLSAVLAALLIQGCAVGPDYREPEPLLPERLGPADAAGITIGTPDALWWQRFDDPDLGELLAEAAVANHDLRIATANLRAARALLREGQLTRLPVVTASGSATREKRSAAAGFPGAPGVGDAETFYDAGFDANWEIDFFGRSRRGVEALRGDLGAQEAARADVLRSVLAEVVRAYVELRGSQARLTVGRGNAAIQEETYTLTQALLDAGRGTDLDLARAEAQLETTRAGIPALEAAVDEAIHRLGVLVGRPPDALRFRLRELRDIPQPPHMITVSSPDELIRNRPDVRRAERQLAAATARIGLAVADLFPRVTLFGSVGYQGTSLSDIGEREAERFQVGPTITWAALDLGRVKSRIDAADARAEAALAGYEQAVLLALEESENAIARYSRSLQAESRLAVAAQASERAAELARLRYRNGADSFLTVLDAEGRMLEAQDLHAQARADTALAAVAVYKSLGGGWE